MKALIYKGPGMKAWDETPDPKIEQPTDVIVKMVSHDYLRHRPPHPQR